VRAEQDGNEATVAAATAARRVDGDGEAGRREAEEARRSAMATAAAAARLGGNVLAGADDGWLVHGLGDWELN
jgi:hypothetical protein